MTIKLTNDSLQHLPKNVPGPAYDRNRLTPGIVHIGMGNFHRAHQAWYLHRLLQQGLNSDWAIIGAGVRPNDAIMRSKLLAQDCLTTLIELDPEGRSAEVTGSIIDYIPVEQGNASLIRQMAKPETRIVSLTVTEGGYYIDPANRGFDSSHPDIQHDVNNAEAPCTAFGAIVAALKIRRARGIGPFTGLSCDNLQGNGDRLRKTVVSLARLSDPELADWIDSNCSFPNSMVDCIVPATGPKELELVKQFGIDDRVPVTHEKFRQWVIEDDFCRGRPEWEKVGAIFTDNVHDFEVMKIRILNGGHQIVAGVGDLLGIKTIAETMLHPAILALYRKVEQEEIQPHVKPVPGFTPEEYVRLIEKRFSNPLIVDTTRRVAFDGSSRHPGFIIPSILQGLEAGTPVEGLALVSACRARYCLGTREDGTVIEPNDPFWDSLQQAARSAKQNPRSWLDMRNCYGELADKPRFADAFEKWLNRIYADGVAATLDAYLDNR
ncbi:MAG: mannitol dehydrogenase [Proteobacteria bacterium]|nr:MAG: mannitol dehydrogenase [Pseudomonadota bacterium]PIE40082.1 MAG: mannitol dehydrogenase [Gammaproteobacteria bacterium]